MKTLSSFHSRKRGKTELKQEISCHSFNIPDYVVKNSLCNCVELGFLSDKRTKIMTKPKKMICHTCEEAKIHYFSDNCFQMKTIHSFCQVINTP
jgi:hypothetical protein